MSMQEAHVEFDTIWVVLDAEDHAPIRYEMFTERGVWFISDDKRVYVSVEVQKCRYSPVGGYFFVIKGHLIPNGFDLLSRYRDHYKYFGYWPLETGPVIFRKHGEHGWVQDDCLENDGE